MNAAQVKVLQEGRIQDATSYPGLATLPVSVQALIADTTANGVHVVCIEWPTGELAVMPCPKGSTWPDPIMVLAAHEGCRAMKS